VESLTSVPGYVQNILFNLLSNALKFRDPGRRPEITVSTRCEEGYVVLTVTDNGLGIDLDRHQGKVFGLYQRFHLHPEGKGLGLHLVKTQSEALGGKVTVESKAGTGSTFRVYFRE
jgi:signal transduction histidine kinase